MSWKTATARVCMCVHVFTLLILIISVVQKKVEMNIRLYLQRNSHCRQVVVFMMCITMFRTCMPTLSG